MTSSAICDMDLLFGLDGLLGLDGLSSFLSTLSEMPSLNSSHESNSKRGQFFPDQCLCVTTFSSGMSCSSINFLISHCAFLTAWLKSPSAFSQISMPIDCVLPGPPPSPACHPC